MNYLIPKRIHSTEREVIDQMDTDCHDVAVESASVSVAGVYWAHGTDEEPDVSGDWVVLSDGRQWGCACIPPYSINPCCQLRS